MALDITVSPGRHEMTKHDHNKRLIKAELQSPDIERNTKQDKTIPTNFIEAEKKLKKMIMRLFIPGQKI